MSNTSFTMDANQTCDILINLVKKSNLNFSLSESPFSVSVTIKKTFIKDKNGVSRVSNIGAQGCACQSDELFGKFKLLQDEIGALKAGATECDDEKVSVDKLNIKTESTTWNNSSTFVNKPSSNTQSTTAKMNTTTLPSLAPNIASLETKTKTFQRRIQTKNNNISISKNTNSFPPKTNPNLFLNPNTESSSFFPLPQINEIIPSSFVSPNPMLRSQDKNSLTSPSQTENNPRKTINKQVTILSSQHFSTPLDQGTGTPVYTPRKLPSSPTPRTPPGRPPGYPTPETPGRNSPPDPLPFPPGSPPRVFGWTKEYFGMTSEEFENFAEVINK